MVGQTILKDAMRRLATIEYTQDNEWMAVLRVCTRREETFLEGLSWWQDHGGKTTDGKRKREDKAVTKPRKQRKTYTAEEKAAYKLQKDKEQQGTNSAQTKQKVVNTDWTTAHQGIKDSIVKDQKTPNNAQDVDLTDTRGQNAIGLSSFGNRKSNELWEKTA